MAAYGTADDAVAAHENIHVEVYIDLKGRQYDDVEEVGSRAWLLRTGVFDRRNLLVHTVVAQRFGCNLVERLHVHEPFDKPFLVHLDHVGSDAAQRKAGFDALVDHALADILHRSERCSARTCLYGEARLEVAAVDYHLGSLLGEENVARVLGVADGTRGDLRRVADTFYHNYAVDINLRYARRTVGIGHKVVGKDNHVVGILCVGEGVADASADRLGIGGTRVSAGIAHRI